jgi:hypothetical protein
MTQEPVDDSSPLAGLKHWGLQTIFYAMAVQASSAGTPLLEIPRMRDAKKKAEDTLNWLWDEAGKDADKDWNAFFINFTRKVLDWTWQHRHVAPKKTDE